MIHWSVLAIVLAVVALASIAVAVGVYSLRRQRDYYKQKAGEFFTRLNEEQVTKAKKNRTMWD